MKRASFLPPPFPKKLERLRNYRSYPDSFTEALLFYRKHRHARFGPMPKNIAYAMRVSFYRFRTAIFHSMQADDKGLVDEHARVLHEIASSFIVRVRERRLNEAPDKPAELTHFVELQPEPLAEALTQMLAEQEELVRNDDLIS